MTSPAHLAAAASLSRNEASPASPKSARIPTLDGLRGCAILLVLLHHFAGFGPFLDGPPGSLRSYARLVLGLGATGVDLFFVLSGFLIGGILLDNRKSPRLIRAFYLRRFFRIVPVAWLCVGLAALLHRLNESGPPAIPSWAGLSFTTNLYLAAANGWLLSPLTAHWSLGIEEQFYLLFPWVVRAWSPRRMAWLGPIMIVGALVLRTVIFLFARDHVFANAMLTVCRLDSLGVGFFAAWLVRSASWPRWCENRRWLWAALLFLALGPVILLKCLYRAPDQMLLWGFTAIALFYGVVLLLVYQPEERWVKSFFGARWLRTYGQFSYFIYLFHVLLARPLVALLFHGQWRDQPTATGWEVLATLVIMLPVAAISWYLLEAPLLKFARRWRYA